MYVDMCTYTEQIGFSRSWRVQVISDFLTRTTTRMAAKTKDAIIWKGERGAKQNKWLFWVMCRAVLSSPIFFPFSTIVYNERRTLKQMVKNQKEELFLKNKTTNFLFGIFGILCSFLTDFVPKNLVTPFDHYVLIPLFDQFRKIKSGTDN